MPDPTPEQTAPPPAGPARLNGWKEIAAYLDRGVRTVQRWEKVFGLPVRRLGPGRGEGVFAFAHEVDTWQATAQAARARSDNLWPSIDSGGDPINADADAGPPGPPDGSSSGLPMSATRGAGSGAASRTRRSKAAVVVLATAMVVAVAWAGWSTWRTFGPSRPAESTPASAGEPASLRVEGNSLAVLDATGRVCWTHAIRTLIDAKQYAGHLPGEMGSVGDIDGDGRREVWFVVSPLDANSAHARLHVFNQDGTLRWVYQHTGSAIFGSETFSGPWAVFRTFVTEDPGTPGKQAFWVSSHDASEFPALLVRLDIATGKPIGGPFWSDGWVSAVTLLRETAGPRLVVGVANNERRAPGIVVLDATNITGTAPAELPKYRCSSCPAGEPLAMALFPRPRRFASCAGSGSVQTIATGGSPSAIVATAIYAITSSGQGAAAVFRLDASLRPLHADPADTYWPVYEQLVREGSVPPTGPLAKDPSRELVPIERWDRTLKRYVPTPLTSPAR